MKRILSFALILFSLFTFLPYNSAHAYTKNDYQMALDQFYDCAFSAEYGGAGRDYTVRWERPIDVYFSGDYSGDDVAFFYQFITALYENVYGMPVIRLTTSESESNVQFYFTDLDNIATYIDSYQEGNWGYFTFWHSGSAITHAKIGIATDVTNQKHRNHLLMEEFVGALGLANDHYLSKKSILYGKWTETQHLTEADWLMLRFLYDPAISSGLTWNEISPILDKRY